MMTATQEAIQSFHFEEDFMENNIRCIPMIVRFKLDACGIKLKLSEWSKFNVEERENLAAFPSNTQQEILQYKTYLQQLVFAKTTREAAEIPVDINPGWSVLHHIPQPVLQRMQEYHWHLSLPQWQNLSDLQRFALIKLSRPSHENRNFPKAVIEFGLAGQTIL